MDNALEETELAKACILGDLEAVKRANKNDVDICVGMFKACDKGHIDIVKYLVEECKAPISLQMTLNACRLNKLDVVKYTIEKTNFHDGEIGILFDGACMYGCMDIVKYLAVISKSKHISHYSYSCYEAHYNVTKYLVEENIIAGKTISNKILSDLLNLGVDPKLLGTRTNKYINKRNKRIEYIKNVMLDKTVLCTDVISVVCSYVDYVQLNIDKKD